MKPIARRSFLLNTLKIGAVLPLTGIPFSLFADSPDDADSSEDTKSAMQKHKGSIEENTSNKYKATTTPDRLILTLTEDPSTSMTINWRTAETAMENLVEYTVADAHPAFVNKVQQEKSVGRNFHFESIIAKNHAVTLKGLLPATVYSYRVGAENDWSEWMQFRTADKSGAQAKISFIYLGDAQVGIRPLWSRVIRKAYAANPDASLVIHAGDLVNRANKDEEWGDWFAAGSFIHSTIPALVTPGNHEYTHEDGKPHLSVYWKEQFRLPANGPSNPLLAGSCYYADIQGVRFISLNTQMLEEAQTQDCITDQVEWLHQVLKSNPRQWTCVIMHHPVFSTKGGRYNKQVRKYLKPVFEQYKVDIVLQGHDHAYGRGMKKIPLTNGSSISQSPTMYVVSVSGSKMYETEPMEWADTITAGVQVYQTINIDNEVLSFKAYLATGQLLDAFDLVKQKGAPNKLIDRISYQDESR